MKKQKLILTALLTASVCLGSLGYAQEAGRANNLLATEELYTPVSCTKINDVYLNQDNDGDTLSDFALYLNDNFQLTCGSTYSALDYAAGQIFSSTKVKFYSPLSNMLYALNSGNQAGLLQNETFWRASRVLPCNTSTRGIMTAPNRVVFEKPSNNATGDVTVGFVYSYTYASANGFKLFGGDTAYRYNKVPNMNYFLNTGLTFTTTLPAPKYNKTRKWNSDQELNSCHNYELHRCGDGTIDTPSSSYVALFTGEICDDGDENGQPGKCDINCGLVGLGGYCGDGITENIAQVRPPYLDTLPAEIVTQLGVEFDSLAEGQTEVCDTGPSNPNDGSGLGFDGECTLACLIAPTIAPEIGFEE